MSSIFSETGGRGILAKRPGRRGIAELVYDGLDDSPDDAFGLAGVDITDQGAADAFSIDVSELTGVVSLRISVFESAIDFDVTDSIQIDRIGLLVVPFASLRASGAGAEARKVMGMTTFSGMLVATLVGVLVVPALFVIVDRYITRSDSGSASCAARYSS